jgi:hypothetical protein
MAPAIVHFLVGASIVLLVAAPLAVRYDVVRRQGVALATVGGIWGLFPDVRLVTPVYEERLEAFHESPWADLFGFHYTLDLDPVRAYEIAESGLVAVIVFVGVAAVFALAAEWGARYEPGPMDLRREMVAGTVGGAAVSALLLGGIFQTSGRMGDMAAVVGRESALAGWTVIVVGAVVAAVAFAVCIELVTRDAATPLASTAFGVLAVVPLWLVTSTLVLPLWKLRVFDAALEISAGDSTSLIAFVLAGGALGATYAGINRALMGRRPRREENPSRPID